MRTYHFAGRWLAAVRSDGGGGLVLAYRPCGMAVAAADEGAAWEKFWAEYHRLAADTRPWRDVRLVR